MTAFDFTDETDVPTELVAVTVNVYLVPLVNPLMTAFVAFAPTFTTIPPGLEVIVYPVIGEPPLYAGKDHDTVAFPLPNTVLTFVGLVGADGGAGITLFVGVDGTDVPMELMAVTVNVYAVPAVSPVSTVEFA